MATSGPPRAEKLIFSDKTLACSNDCAPKLTYLRNSAAGEDRHHNMSEADVGHLSDLQTTVWLQERMLI